MRKLTVMITECCVLIDEDGLKSSLVQGQDEEFRMVW